MHIQLKKTGQLMLVAAASIGAATWLSACTQLTGTLTADFVYVTSAKAAGPNNYGEVDVFEINAESGRMRQIPSSPFPSGGRNPVAEATSTDHNNLYVINHDDNTIVQFIIGSDGKLYPNQTVNTPGVFPLAVAVSGSNLYVADTYQPLPACSTASPCSGSIASFPIGTNGLLGTAASNPAISASYWPLSLPGSPKDILAPSAIVASGSSVFVAAQDTSSGLGYIFGFSSSNGTLSPLNNGVPFNAGTQPSSMILDPTGAHLYVTDEAKANIHGFSVSASGLTELGGSPYPAGNRPASITIDAKGQFAYVANSQDSNVMAFGVTSTGDLQQNGTYTVDTQPVAIGIDPNLNQYLFTANFLSNSVSGFQIDPNTGALLNSQNSPYAANANPTAAVAIPHKVQQ